MYEAAEVNSSAVIAVSEAPEMLEAVGAAFDPIVVLVGGAIVRDGDLAVALGGDDGGGVQTCDPVA